MTSSLDASLKQAEIAVHRVDSTTVIIVLCISKGIVFRPREIEAEWYIDLTIERQAIFSLRRVSDV